MRFVSPAAPCLRRISGPIRVARVLPVRQPLPGRRVEPTSRTGGVRIALDHHSGHPNHLPHGSDSSSDLIAWSGLPRDLRRGEAALLASGIDLTIAQAVRPGMCTSGLTELSQGVLAAGAA